MEAPSRNFAALSKETAYLIYRMLQHYINELTTYAGDEFLSPDQKCWVQVHIGLWRDPNGQIRTNLELASYCTDLACSAAPL